MEFQSIVSGLTGIRQFRFLALFAAGMAMIVLGCSRGPRLYPVTGKVQFDDDRAVTFGTIECISRAEKLVARGIIERDGTFRLGTHRPGDGAVAGEHQVIVLQSIPPVGQEFSHAAHGRTVPRRYGSYTTSGLMLEVSPEEPNDDVVIRIGPDRPNRP